MRSKLKYKIISLITVFTALSVLLILYISLQTFQKDKSAFIFETSLNTTRFLSEQLKTEIENKSVIVKNYLKLFFSNKNNAVQVIDDSESIDEIQVYEKKIDSLEIIFEVRKKNLEDFDFKKIASLSQSIDLILTADKQTKNSGVYVNHEKIFVYELLRKLDKSYLIIYSYTSKSIRKMFNEDNYFKSILIDNSGSLVSQNFSQSENDFIHQFSEFNLKNSQNLKKTLNTSVFMLNSEKNEKWMFASSEIGYFDLYLVTAISETSAFGFINKLYLNSILIFGILISFVVLVGFVATHLVVGRLQQLTFAAEKVSTGDFSVSVSDSGKDEVGVLSQAFNNMIRKIDALLNEVAGKTRMELELKTAQLVQSTLFPAHKASFSGMNISGYYKSASECGGDWWHYSETEQYVWVWIADATGHGVSAALLTSACKSAVHLIEQMDCEPEEAMKLLNSSIYDVSAGKMMMTCFVLRFNKLTKEIKYVNASHEIPIQIPVAQNIAVQDLNFVFSPDQRNLRLGQQKLTHFTANTLALKEKDRLFLYTDGFFELTDTRGNQFKERHLLKALVLEKNKEGDFSEFTNHFDQNVETLIRDQELKDDLTYILIEVCSCLN
jgi:sigma-B regulation protein RsbU (phosphoserine phosphatase)